MGDICESQTNIDVMHRCLLNVNKQENFQISEFKIKDSSKFEY